MLQVSSSLNMTFGVALLTLSTDKVSSPCQGPLEYPPHCHHCVHPRLVLVGLFSSPGLWAGQGREWEMLRSPGPWPKGSLVEMPSLCLQAPSLHLFGGPVVPGTMKLWGLPGPQLPRCLLPGCPGGCAGSVGSPPPRTAPPSTSGCTAPQTRETKSWGKAG